MEINGTVLFSQYKKLKYILVTKGGKLIYSPENRLFFEDVNRLLAARNFKAELASNGAMNYSVGKSFIVITTSRGYKEFKGSGWGSLMTYDAGEIFAPIAELKKAVFLSTMFFSLGIPKN